MPEIEVPSNELWVVMILWQQGALKKWIPTTASALTLNEGTVRLRRLEDSALLTKTGKEYKLQRYTPKGE